MSAGAWFGWLTVAGVLIVAGIYRIRKHGRAEGGEVTPLDDLMDGPEQEQVGDDTLAMLNDRLDRIQVTLSATAPVVPSATDDWADLTEGIVYGPEILRRIREGLREQVIDHVAAEVAEDIEGEWRDLATRPAAEWPGGAS
jgi:hypothetical protein